MSRAFVQFTIIAFCFSVGLPFATIGTHDWMKARIERTDAHVVAMREESNTGSMGVHCVATVKFAASPVVVEVLAQGPCGQTTTVKICYARVHPTDVAVNNGEKGSCSPLGHTATKYQMVVGWAMLCISVLPFCGTTVIIRGFAVVEPYNRHKIAEGEQDGAKVGCSTLLYEALARQESDSGLATV